MNIPPFPSQDLAKLVLGYLAEEQLMTAYDEFLSASPYLDALRNEYDRIFMTSLKSILAEYRAVKIYVETCKPHALRRRLLGCTNLLDIVKFLVQNVDISKLHVPEGNRTSSDTHNICAVCHSHSCVCRSQPSIPRAGSQSHLEDHAHDTSVEATPLEDLPGNHVTSKKKQVKTMRKQCISSQSTGSDVDIENDFTPNFEHSLPNSSLNQISRLHANSLGTNSNIVLERPNPAQSLNQPLAYNSNPPIYQTANINCTSNVFTHRISTAGTFQDFTSGVRGTENINSNVPDSSTSENFSSQSFLGKDFGIHGYNINAKPTSKPQIFLTVGTINAPAPPIIDERIGIRPICSSTVTLPPKPNESKVTILSNIKVDKPSNDKMPAILKNATSSPLMHMQTILINGSPVYNKPPPRIVGPNRNFTKDEIMAMPTIIVVPSSGASQVNADNRAEIPPQPPIPPPSTISSTTQPLDPLTIDVHPLTIDVPSNSPALALNTTVPENSNMPLLDQGKENEDEMLVKPVGRMVSAPRAGSPGARSTPQGPPPARKSSSTPRRNSHVRVLDFATPRRILQEPIRENVAEEGKIPEEVVISRSPNLHVLAEPTDAEHAGDKSIKTDSSTANSSGSLKENDNVQKAPSKKSNWDTDLRAVAITNKKEDIPNSNIQPRCRPKQKTKKNKSSQSDKKNKNKGKGCNKSVRKCADDNVNKNIKKKKKSNDAKEDPVIVVDDSSNVPIKPTINIIAGQDWNTQESDKNQNKPNSSEPTDTPEMDRLSLQNVIGAKLNISELLETPYKQALYDIQMETPKFLGPDLPDVPMSDIKIMNIPTPRFLDTPKPVQATPSSYSSRPTDYSSGGSYYKPDDQDFNVPLADLGYPVSVPAENEIVNNADGAVKQENIKQKSGSKSRPTRKCAKNVSYYSSPIVNKTKETCDKTDRSSVCSDSLSINSSTVITIENASEPKSNKKSKPKSKRDGISKKHKSPAKRETPKTFMKIKPRRVTPTKESAKGKVKVKKSPKKRTSSKEKKSPTIVLVAMPTKSRRKSSTPRKLNCAKNYNTESSGHDSPELAVKTKEDHNKETQLLSVPDSDTEQVPLHWSDDGSQDAKPNEQDLNVPANETEDITKIKEYIASECLHVAIKANDHCSNLHADLVKRGFDAETAKIIERDLLDSPADMKETNSVKQPVAVHTTKDKADLDKTLESDTSSALKITQEDDEDEDCEEIELGESECYEDSDNFITCNHEDLKYIPRAPSIKLKDKFSMEVCIDDTLTVRLRATPVTTLLDQDPNEYTEYDERETEMAVNSIANIEKLYTPMKDPDIRAQVYDIFDSTLTSLDTPLKPCSPKRKECEAPVTEIILEVEKVEDKEKPDDKKRKRLHSSESTDSATSSKRTKPDPHYLLHSTNIQNIDIESVLSKLHGP